jgi:hypothetical protein
MNALAILTNARNHGVKVTVDGDQLVLEGDITPEMVASFKANKPEILKLLTPDVAPKIPSSGTRPGIMSEALGLICDDCGRPTAVALVTDYGSRYCRECVFSSETRREPEYDWQGRQVDLRAVKKSEGPPSTPTSGTPTKVP